MEFCFKLTRQNHNYDQSLFEALHFDYLSFFVNFIEI